VLLGAPPASAQAPSPNDPRFSEQWALERLAAPCAWERTIGSADVTVAVVDSGVDMGHPDLVGRLRADGADFVDGDDDPSDENGHGTNVAGIIAATLDNAEGGAGLAPGVQILPVRVMNRKGFGSDRAIAEGIRFAVERGAKVINLSLGATLMVSTETESEAVIAAIRDAQDSGALVVVAAGNDFVPLPNAIVGDNPDVLVVAATDPGDRKADFSNSGPWVNVAAPGVQILSTMPTYEVYLTSPELPRDERFQQGYDAMSGTSQAAPFVSALAALLFSAHPGWTASDVARHIRETAAAIAERNPGVQLGGRIDACAALATGTAGPSPEATAAPAAPSLPVEEPAAPQLARLPLNALLGLGALACGGATLLALAVLGVLLMTRRPATSSHRPHASPPLGGWGSLTVIGGPAQSRAYVLVGSATQIGREADCAVVLIGDGTVSRRHALVRNDGRRVTVEDLNSSHGTYLNGRRVTRAAQVRSGDVIQVGQTQLRFG
jgi:type VII secretion-associated serine protease mycosin